MSIRNEQIRSQAPGLAAPGPEPAHARPAHGPPFIERPQVARFAPAGAGDGAPGLASRALLAIDRQRP